MAPQNNGITEDSSSRPGKPGNLKILIPLLLFVAALIVGFRLYMVHKRNFVTTNDAYIDANRVSVSAKMLGRISQLFADEGDSVRVGQMLVKLDESDLTAHEAQARAACALARENIRLAEITLQRAEADYQRAKAQFDDRVISQEQYDHAENGYKQAKARVAIAKAQAQSATAQLGIVETQLQNSTVYSPIDGVVSKRWALSGDVVQPGQSIFAVYDLKNIWVTANIEETRIARLYEGLPVEIQVDAYPRTKFRGRVEQIASNTAAQFSLIPPNNAAGNFTKITQRIPVKIALNPSDNAGTESVHLLPGMSVSVIIKVR